MRPHFLVSLLMMCGVHTASAEPIAVIPSPGDSASGLGWDGEFLWVANLRTATGGGSNRVSRLDPRTGIELGGFDMQFGDVFHGIAFDGEGNLLTDNFNKSVILDTDIVVLDPTGVQLAVFPALGTIYGVALDNDNGRLFQVDNHSVEAGGSDMKNHLYELDPSDGSVVRGPIELPIRRARGVAWDGSALWVASNSTDSIYRVDVETGAIIDQFVAPGAGGVEGLAYDGSCLWISDTRDDTIYRVDHGQSDLPDCVPFEDPDPEPDPDPGTGPEDPPNPDPPEGTPPPGDEEGEGTSGCSVSSQSNSWFLVTLVLAFFLGRRRRGRVALRCGRFALLAVLLLPACSSELGGGPDTTPPGYEPDASAEPEDPVISYRVETIDGDGFASGTTSVVLDAQGNPHVAYLDAKNDDLRYAWFNGETWTRETVDMGGVGWPIWRLIAEGRISSFSPLITRTSMFVEAPS
jgi:MYXO-CTERM domain-containing protein